MSTFRFLLNSLSSYLSQASPFGLRLELTMVSSPPSPHSGHLGTAWETAVVAVFAVIIVVVGIVAFYFRRRRMRRRLTDRIHSPANFTRDPEQGAISPSFENSPRSREMRGIGDVDASIAKPERAVSSSSPRQSISSPHHSEITQKQGTFKSPRYYWEPK